MSLIRYYINASKVPLDERKELFKKIENLAYIHNYDLKNIGCLEASFHFKDNIEDVVNFPEVCVITRL